MRPSVTARSSSTRGGGDQNAYLSESERQAIFDNDMLPHLQAGDFDGAISVALARVDAAATPEHAKRLEGARQVNAVVGLVGAPIVFLGLVGGVVLAWRRYGKTRLPRRPVGPDAGPAARPDRRVRGDGHGWGTSDGH